MPKALVPAAAAVTLPAGFAAAQRKEDIGYEARANAFEQLDAAVATAAFVEHGRRRAAGQ